MEQRVSLVTLGVRDLQRAKQFYGGLGWVGQEVEQTVFFQAGGLAVVLWGREQLAADCGLADAPEGAPDRFGGTALAHNVRSRDEVDAVLAEAVTAGGRLSRAAADTFYGGYAGVFTDPDGHPWEVSWNPGLPLADDGTLVVPDLGGG